MNFQFTYTLAGTDISSIVQNMRFSFNKGVKQVSITIDRRYLSTYSISNGSSVLIQYGTTDASSLGYAFRGTVENVEESGTNAVISCNDKLFQLTGRLVNNVYYSSDAFSGKISSILIDMISTYGELTATTDTVEDTGVLTVNDQLWCFDSVVMEKVSELSKVPRYIFYYDDSDDKVYAHSKGYRSCADSFTYSQSGSNISSVPVWNDDTTNVFNYLKLTGANRTGNHVQYFTGDGSTLNFTLTYVPANKVNVIVEEEIADAWTLQTYGISGITASYDYSVDDNPSVKQIQYVSGNAPAAADDNVRVYYSFNVKLFSEFVDTDSKDDYPASDGGYRYASYVNENIKTIDDLERVGNSLIENFSNPFTSVNFTTNNLTEIPMYGMSVTITDTVNNRSGSYILSKFSFSTRKSGFSFSLEESTGDVSELLYTNNDRLTRLEDSSRGNQTAITDSRAITPTVDVTTLFSVSSFDRWVDTWDTTDYWGEGTENLKSSFSNDFPFSIQNSGSGIQAYGVRITPVIDCTLVSCEVLTGAGPKGWVLLDSDASIIAGPVTDTADVFTFNADLTAGIVYRVIFGNSGVGAWSQVRRDNSPSYPINGTFVSINTDQSSHTTYGYNVDTLNFSFGVDSSEGTWGSSNHSDDFSTDLTSTNWTETGTWSVSSDVYSVDSSGGRSIWKYADYSTYQNPIINIKLKPVTDETVGVLFRFDGTDGYCIRYKNATTIQIGLFNTSTNFTEISSTTYARALGVWTFWKILVKDNKISLLAGDCERSVEEIFSTTDDTISTSGSVGLIAFSTDACFNDFEVGEVEDLQV